MNFTISKIYHGGGRYAYTNELDHPIMHKKGNKYYMELEFDTEGYTDNRAFVSKKWKGELITSGAGYNFKDVNRLIFTFRSFSDMMSMGTYLNLKQLNKDTAYFEFATDDCEITEKELVCTINLDGSYTDEFEIQ